MGVPQRRLDSFSSTAVCAQAVPVNSSSLSLSSPSPKPQSSYNISFPTWSSARTRGFPREIREERRSQRIPTHRSTGTISRHPLFLISRISAKSLSLGLRIALEGLKHRVFEVSLADLQKDKDQAFRKIRLRAEDVQGRNVLTNFHDSGTKIASEGLRHRVFEVSDLDDLQKNEDQDDLQKN
ncbi:40S ribosomal protein S3-1 [Datura stramonium]|uniref:40S ribosomal protein S3-1 n=1 Tax=Datura stramonium TaxID=4076 RepID=A0ABS8TRN1_DATST|nr:40S ribosomal protein S3-1 [Datura stramonium]